MPTMERGYWGDGEKDGGLMTLSENLDPAILPTGLVSYLNHYIALKKKKLFQLSCCYLQSNNPDGCMILFFASNAKPGIICCFVRPEEQHPSLPFPPPHPIILGKFFLLLKPCGLYRSCHTVDPTFSATFDWLRNGF